MKIGVKVGDIMTRDFVSVKPDVNITDCARLMIKKRVGSLILQENEELKGLLTERDIIWVMTKKPLDELKMIKARDVANKKVITIKPNADLYDALQKMRKNKYRWLPVVIKKKVIGFLTLKDILKIEPSLFEIAREGWQIKEEEEKLRRASRRSSFNLRAEEGICEECGNVGFLYKTDGRLICDNCRESM